MRHIARRRPSAEGTATVESWGIDPTGAAKIDSILVANGRLLAGFTGPTPAGWGETGSFETTDQHVYASPQAFTAAAGPTALTIWGPGGARPIKYPTGLEHADTGKAVSIVLPGPGGI